MRVTPLGLARGLVVFGALAAFPFVVHADWIVNIGGDCRSKYSVEAAATHEFGHAFGLGHVSESLHPALTMSPVIAACQSSETTLGLGDVRGLEAKY